MKHLLAGGLLMAIAAGGANAAEPGVAGPGAPPTGKPVVARYVRVESGTSVNYLHFAELEVYAAGRNVAVGKPATASSTMNPFTPDKAVDGVVAYTWGVNPSFWSSAGKAGKDWWEVDLGAAVPIDRLALYNRSDAAQERLTGAVLSALAADRSVVFQCRLDAATDPTDMEFVVREAEPVDLDATAIPERMAAVAPRFDSPSSDAAYVMPVGAGDLSAMLRYDHALQIHLSKTDFFVPGNIASPGHLTLDFGIAPEALTGFEQRLDLVRGSVVLALETADGTVRAEAFGVMGRNTLRIAVEDTRPRPRASVGFSVWRAAMAATAADSRIMAVQVQDTDERGRPVADPDKASADDRVYGLGVAVAAAFADAKGLVAAECSAETGETTRSATLRAAVGSRYELLITCATTYDRQPDAAAAALLDAGLAADRTALRDEQLAWWRRFWDQSWLDLHGRDAEYLMRLWYVTLYSYASVGEGPVLPKFNGGPGLVHDDDRHWGWGYWWQNTRELIWPMFAANHLRYARNHLDFYDRTFPDYQAQTAQRGKLGIRVWEMAHAFKPGTPARPRSPSPFDAALLDKALADRRMENATSGYNARSMAQVAELVQQFFEYVAYTGDEAFLHNVAAPWLREAALFYLSYLKLEEDGRYHMTPADALEQWWRVKDPMTDMCAVRLCFWRVLDLGPRFGYEPEFMAAVRDRLDRLAPLPTGAWSRRPARDGEIPPGRPGYVRTVLDAIDRDAPVFAPAADILDDPCVYNMENPELYLIYPFALVDANAPKADFDRAVNTFKARKHPNQAGWSQCGIQAARLRLPDTIDVIMDHARKHQTYPYGGWRNVAKPLTGSKLGVSDVPYFDTAGANMTALQEALLQSHVLTTPAPTDPLGGGPILLIPAVRRDWAGRFRLRARGGFLVTARFQPGHRVERVTVEAERGGMLRLVNPFPRCRVSGVGIEDTVTGDSVLAVPLPPGAKVEFQGER